VPLLIAAFAVAAVMGCGRQEGNGGAGATVVTSCLIADEQGRPMQCFEYSDSADKKASRAAGCKEFEGKPTFLEGACPSEGRVGTCTSTVAGATRIERGYRSAESLQKRCAIGGGTFSPN
jgi:hypothetical protein